MVASNFKASLAHALVFEGGYVNHPKDPGGATKWGVIQRTYDAFRKSMGLKPRSVKLLTTDERDKIYDAQYWDVIKGDQLPKGVDFAVFDGAINSGPIQSGKWLQRALGGHYRGNIDGQIGLETLKAVGKINDHDALVDRYYDRRLAFLKSLRTWATFGRGWMRRINTGKALALQMADGTVADPVVPAPLTLTKAMLKASPVEAPEEAAPGVIEDRKSAPQTAGADAATGGGTGTAGVAQYIDQAKESVMPASGTRFIDTVIVVLTIAGVVIAVGGIAWGLYARYRRKQLADALDVQRAPA